MACFVGDLLRLIFQLIFVFSPGGELALVKLSVLAGCDVDA